ncbi:melatonin receptor type 1A-like [Patiria miniata]|uniref:G-protein coupled receptors family 1 profile domain-containing protein n=1 Tax=Patiria miniata TaxID=46514 RepID=A0A913ZRW3_PATMI|nr:melatonin receptor type 1A-like [Patiria miniata]
MDPTQIGTVVSGDFPGNFTTAATPGLTGAMMTTDTVAPSAGESVELYSYKERVFIGLMWLIISILGMTGNGMVILAVALSRKLRTPTNVFVVNLAVADFLSCFCLPWSVAGLFSRNGLPGAHVPCMLTAFISYVSSGASLYHMASIALNRVILIKRPMTLYQWLYTPAKIVFLVVLSWLVAFCVILLPPLANIGGLGYDEEEYTCTDQDTHPMAKLYQLIQVVFFFPGPMLIIIICYALVFAHVRSHFIAQRKRRPSTIVSKDAPSGPISSNFIPSDCPQVQGPDTMDNQVHAKLSRQQIQITKNLLMIVVVYFVCITPYSVMLFMGSGYTLYGGTIFLCNTWINPIVYATKHPQLKVVLRMMIRCRCSKIPEPSRLVRRLSSKNVALNQVNKA